MRAGWSFSQKAVRIRGESTTLVPSYAAGLEDVVIETPDRGQSPNGRSRWSQSTHHPSITVPNPARGCDLYVFHLRITYPCRARHEVIRLSFLRFYIPSARSPLAPRLHVPLDLVFEASSSRCVPARRVDHYSNFETRSEFRSPHGTYKCLPPVDTYIPQPIYLVAISRNI